MAGTSLSYCAAELRRHDPDRYLTALFARAHIRPALFALYAFNLELARVRESVQEPLLGRLRLQWWREALADVYAGNPRPHPVAEALAEAKGNLDRACLDRLIDARERDMDGIPPADLAALVAYADGTSGGLTMAALGLLGAAAHERALAAGRHVGTAWALVGLVRAVPFHARARRLYLPREAMARHGVAEGDVLALHSSAALAAVAEEVAGEARRHLAAARAVGGGLPRRLLPALLPASLADLYLGRLERAGHDPFAEPVQRAPQGRIWRLAASAALGRF